MALEAQRDELREYILNVEGKSDLLNLIRSMNLGDLQAILIDHINNEQSSDKMTKMYYSTRSLTNIFPSHIVQYMLEYLQPLELFNISSTSKLFNELIKNIVNKDITYKRWILSHEAFDEFWQFIEQHDERRGTWKIGWFLQNKYDISLLNEYKFFKLGELDLLLNHDKIIYYLCKHFGLKTSLWIYSKPPDDSQARKVTNYYPLGNHSENRYWSGWNVASDEFDSMEGYKQISHAIIEHIEDGEYYDICPIIRIKGLSKKWVKKHFPDHFKGTMVEDYDGEDNDISSVSTEHEDELSQFRIRQRIRDRYKGIYSSK